MIASAIEAEADLRMIHNMSAAMVGGEAAQKWVEHLQMRVNGLLELRQTEVDKAKTLAAMRAAERAKAIAAQAMLVAAGC